MQKIMLYHSRSTNTRVSGQLAFSWFLAMIALPIACIWCTCAWFAKWVPALWDLGNFGAADSDLCKTDDLKWMMMIFLDGNAPILCIIDGEPDHVTRCAFAWSGHLHACKWPFGTFVENFPWLVYMWCWLHDGVSGSWDEVLCKQRHAILMLQTLFSLISLIWHKWFVNLMMS